MSFCNIQVKRNSSEYKVINKQGKESILYPVIVTNINDNTYNDNKDYFDDLLSDGKIQSLDNKELALGIYSIAYNSDKSEQYWLNENRYLELLKPTKLLNNTRYIKPDVSEVFKDNPELANQVYETLGFKNKNYASKLKEIVNRRKLATKQDLKNSQLIENIRVNKSQSKSLKPNEADLNLASIMLYGHRYSDLNDMNYLDDNIMNINNPDEMRLEAKTLAYRILNDLMFNIEEINEFYDEIKENPKYATTLTNSKNPIKEFFENDIFEEVEKTNLQITSQQKQEALQKYSQYLNTVFPNSKIKDVVYHSTKADKLNIVSKRIDDSVFWMGTKDNIKIGFYSTTNKEYSQSFITDINEKDEPVLNGNTFSLLINIENPFYANSNDTTGIQIEGITEEQKNELDENGYDGILDLDEKYTTEDIVIFEPEQVHILGSKQDIEGFKNYIQSNKMFRLQTNPDYYNLLQDAEKTKQYLDYDNAKSLIQDYMKVSKDINQQEVAKFILANIDKINPRIKPFPLKLRNEDAYGQYDHLTNTIFYNPETLPSNPDLLLYLFNHEMIHALTMSPMMRDAIMKDGKLIEIINKIREEFTEYDDYGFTDEFEFVAEYLTNIKFKRKVNTKLSQPTYKSFFDTILDLIRNIFSGNKNLASIENMFKDIIEKSTISDYYSNRDMLNDYVLKQKEVYDSGTMSNPPLYLEDLLDKPQIGNMSPMEKKNIIIDKYGKKFGKNKTIIDPQSNWGKLTSEIAEYNKGYGNKVLSLYQAPNGEWYIKIVEDKLDNKIGQLKGLKKDINENEISKMPTFNYTQYIDDLDFLSEDESEFVNSLFENGEQTLTCSI